MSLWRMLTGSIILVTATVALLGGLGWRKYQSMQAAKAVPPPPEMPISVVVAPVSMTSFRRHSTMIGTIMAPRSITLSNEMAGTVREIKFTSGGTVDADQVLVRLDASVEEARLEAAKARKRLADSTLKRLQSIKGVDAISQLELDEAIARRDEAAAEVVQLQAMIERLTIRAPFRAIAGLSDTHPGQYLPSGTTITTLQSLDGFLLVDFMLPQEVADVVQVDDTVKLESVGEGQDAKIVAFNSIADRNTRNLEVRARIENPPPQLQPGDSVRIVVEYGPTIQAPAVPVQALRRSPAGALVYIAELDPEGKLRVKSRAIQPGPSAGDRVIILQGISTRDKVVADGSFKLHDGALILDVAVLPPPAPPASSDTANRGNPIGEVAN